MKKRLTLPIIILFLIISNNDSNAYFKKHRVKGKILKFGIVTSDTSIKYLNRDLEVGYGTWESELRVIEKRDTLALKKGLKFGYEWEISGLPRSKSVMLEYNISHPLVVNHYFKAVKNSKEELNFYSDSNGVVNSVDGFCLCEDNLIVAGIWTISIAYKHRVIVTKSFFVQ